MDEQVNLSEGGVPVLTSVSSQSSPVESITPTWSWDWPTSPGLYWFYGFRFRKYEVFSSGKQKPKMFFVEANKVSNGIMYKTNGAFLYKQEGAYGMWMPAMLPIPPVEIQPR